MHMFEGDSVVIGLTQQVGIHPDPDNLFRSQHAGKAVLQPRIRAQTKPVTYDFLSTYAAT